ncbi:hypothetical protein RJT34_12634 [Clitoria ternatea]|uniref:Smr domain-containing protein n=1 Tax=Clitoria ternatea TaxID=43366 RepID=A0AAN9PJH6_CLITE
MPKENSESDSSSPLRSSLNTITDLLRKISTFTFKTNLQLRFPLKSVPFTNPRSSFCSIPNMKNTRKKKRPKSEPQKKNVEEKKEEERVLENEEYVEALKGLVENFSLSSIEEAHMKFGIGRSSHQDKGLEILRKSLGNNVVSGGVEDHFLSSSSSSSGVSSSGLELGSSSGSSSSDGFVEQSCCEEEDVACFKSGRLKKKVVASTGTVSTVLGKEYVRRNSNRNNKGFNANGVVVDKEEAEQFLCSMLGDDSDLNLAVVRDVLCQCGYNIEKASDILLDLAGSTIEPSSNGRLHNYRVDNIDDEGFLDDRNNNLIDRRSECTSLSSEGEYSDNLWSLGSFGRNYAEVLSSSKANSDISPGYTKSDIPQKVLESLFNIPKSSEPGKDTMDWRNVVKKMQSLGPGFDKCKHVAEPQHHTYAKGDAYHIFREDAKQHWDSVKSCYQNAGTAYTKGNRAYAAYLSDQGKEQTKLAQKADAKASHDIFLHRNKDIENLITIDLHGQHVKPAMRMLKVHLLFGSYVPSVQALRIITGCGSHGYGKSKLKQSVLNLLNKEGIEWSEENRGTVLIKLKRYRELSFLDTNSDSDND